MRYGTAEHLRRAGYDARAVAELEALREVYEGFLRGQIPRTEAQLIVDRMAERPWFGLAWVPRRLHEGAVWDDMDFDPAEPIGKISCPVLAFYGEHDEWVPVSDSVQVWQERYKVPSRFSIVRLPGAGHHPTEGGRLDVGSVNPHYTATLTHWLDHRLATSTSAAGSARTVNG